MTSDSPERWRLDARFLLRGGATVFGVGVVIALVAQMGAGDLHPLGLLLSGLANAGLPDPYLLRRGAKPEPLSVGGPRMPLGLRPDQTYLPTQAALSPGDGLLLFSDGLAEAPDPGGEPLGYEALVDLLPALESEPGAWLDGLFARIRQVTAPELADDWTALLLEHRS